MFKLFELFDKKNKVAILAYHRVAPTSYKETLLREMIVFLEDFEEQMIYIREHYKVVSLDELSGMLDGEFWDNKYAVITFDDAYLDNYTYALPILRKYGIPATIFVPTAFIKTEKRFLWDELSFFLNETKEEVLEFEYGGKEYCFDLRNNKKGVYAAMVNMMKDKTEKELTELQSVIKNRLKITGDKSEPLTMSWDQMREMKNYDIDFGAHTHSHCVVSKKNADEQFQEMIFSKKILDKELDQETTSFAYPFGGLGDIGKNASNMVAKAGYNCAVTMEQGLVYDGDNKYMLKRIGVGGSDDFKKFVLKISGLIPFISNIKKGLKWKR